MLSLSHEVDPAFREYERTVVTAFDAYLKPRVDTYLARLEEGGRLVAITGANLAPDNPAWRDGFIRLQERGRVVFSAAIDGRVYARHGTSVDTRLTVIDRIPADDPISFPGSPGIVPDAVTLLDQVIREVPPRAPAGRQPASLARMVGLPRALPRPRRRHQHPRSHGRINRYRQQDRHRLASLRSDQVV